MPARLAIIPNRAVVCRLRALHFVVKDRIFEGHQIESGRVFHDPDADVIGETVAEQTIYQRNKTAERVRANRK